MSTPKFTEKQKSEMIMRIYFPELFPDQTYIPFPKDAPQIPKEMYDRWVENTKAFIKLN